MANELSRDELEYRLAVAYQVVGVFLDRVGLHDTEQGAKLLDYFNGDKDAPNPLPFSLPVIIVGQNNGMG